MWGFIFYMMIIDIDNKEVNIGDDIIFCDNMGVNKGKVLKIGNNTIKVEYYKIHDMRGGVGELMGIYQFIRLTSNNGRYIYKI